MSQPVPLRRAVGVASPPASPWGVAGIVLACLFWGTTGTAASFLPASVSPIAVGAATMGVGGALLFLVSVRGAIRVIRDRRLVRWVALGAVGVVVYPLAFYTGMEWAGVAVGNVVALGSGPVFAALIEWITERRGLTRRWVIATGVAVAGVAALSVGRADDVSGNVDPGRVTAGVAVALLAGAAYALYTVASARAIREDSSLRAAPVRSDSSRSVMGAMFGMASLALLPVLFVVGGPLLQSTQSLAIASYLALGPTLVAYLLFGFGLRTVRGSLATTITLLEPAIATVLAIAVVGERLSPIGWTGFALIMVGLTILLSPRWDFRRNPTRLERS